MSLLPYYLDYELQPQKREQLEERDIRNIFDHLTGKHRRRQLWRDLSSLSSLTRDEGSKIKNEKDKFQINLDVQHFAPEEVTVKIIDNCIVVEGEHEEKEDDHGYISRKFKRRYTIPEGCNPDVIESKLSSDGVLSITAPKKSSDKTERVIPITQTGPIRRKIEDNSDDDTTNGVQNDSEKSKSVQKKKKN